MRAGALGLVLLIAGASGAAAGGGYASLEGHGGPVKGVAISADGSYALTASFDYSVGLWDLRSNTLVRWLEGHEAAASDAAAATPAE